MSEEFLVKVLILFFGNLIGFIWLGGAIFGVLGAMVGFIITFPVTSLMISALSS